jgi:nicotinic acid mononucleotide adenylyltransferase
MGVLAVTRYSISPSVRTDERKVELCLIDLTFFSRNVIVIKQLIYNDISSTKVRYVASIRTTLCQLKLCVASQAIRTERDEHQVSIQDHTGNAYPNRDSLSRYLLPNSVIQYIHQNKLYLEPDRAVNK